MDKPFEKQSFAQRLNWIHTWSGLVLGWLCFAVFLNGTLSVFWMEISHWARPEVHAIKPLAKPALTQFATDYLNRVAPESRRWYVHMGDYERDPILGVHWFDANNANQYRLLVPDGSGRPVVTETQGGRFFVDFHWSLNRPFEPGGHFSWTFMLAGAAGMAFLIGTLSGLIVHRKFFKNFYTFRPKAKSAQQRWLDAHNMLGVLPWPFHLMIVVSGLLFYSYNYIPSGVRTAAEIPRVPAPRTRENDGPGPFHFGARYNEARAGQVTDILTPPPGKPAVGLRAADLVKRAEADMNDDVFSLFITNPSRDNATILFTGGRERRVTFTTKEIKYDGMTGGVLSRSGKRPWFQEFYNVNAGMHFAFFGGSPMRWLYFICGSAGTVMLACGLLVFTAKRRARVHSARAARFYAFVDRMNVAAIAGGLFASVVYLWGVRLLPTNLPPTGGGFYNGVYATLRVMPLDRATRPDWELYTFYVAWAVAIVHALLRAPAKAWFEQLSVIAALCVGLPVIGYLVPNSGLFHMIAAGDWATASVDLAGLVFGIAFAWVAYSAAGKRTYGAFTRSKPVPVH